RRTRAMKDVMRSTALSYRLSHALRKNVAWHARGCRNRWWPCAYRPFFGRFPARTPDFRYGTRLESKQGQEDRPMRVTIIGSLTLALVVGLTTGAFACPLDGGPGVIPQVIAAANGALGAA